MSANTIYYALKEQSSENNCMAVVKKGTDAASTYESFVEAIRDHFDDADLVLPLIARDFMQLLEDRVEYGKSGILYITNDEGYTHVIEIERTFVYGV